MGINPQMLIIPAPTYSGAIIAAAELKYSNNLEKLQALGEIVDAPHELPDWFHFSSIAGQNNEKIAKLLGLRWQWRSRLSGMKNFPLPLLMSMILLIKRHGEAMKENTEKICMEYREKNGLKA